MNDDFLIDSGEWFPEQNAEGRFTECVGITVADICGDIDNINYDPDFSYAMALRLAGSQPTTAGSDPHAGMLSAVAWGCLPMSDADFTALTHGELYVANWQNYSLEDRQTAQQHTQKCVTTLPLNFDAVLSAARVNRGVGFHMYWYSSFSTPNLDGTVNLDRASSATVHFARIVGQKTLDGVRYILLKPWMGKQYGFGGYCLLTEQQFLQVAIGAYAFDPNGSRLLTLVGIAATRLPYLLDVLPYLYLIGVQNLQTIINGKDVSAGAETLPHNSPPNVPSEVPLVAPTVPQDAPKYDWSTQLAAKHSVRLICDEEGLDWATKNELTACIRQESQFLPHAIGRTNTNGTQDFGLCQYNNGKDPKTGKPLWIGLGAAFSSVEEVLDNPEKNVRVMARCFKAGQKSLWSSYKTGAYKKWLSSASNPTVV